MLHPYVNYNISDNSGPYTLTSNNTGLGYPAGSHTIKLVALDAAGNKNTCSISLNVLKAEAVSGKSATTRDWAIGAPLVVFFILLAVVAIWYRQRRRKLINFSKTIGEFVKKGTVQRTDGRPLILPVEILHANVETLDRLGRGTYNEVRCCCLDFSIMLIIHRFSRPWSP